MICTSVIPCLSSGLAKNNKIMFMFVLWLFGHFESLAFLRKWGDRSYTKVIKQHILLNFSKVRQLSNNVSKSAVILTKK